MLKKLHFLCQLVVNRLCALLQIRPAKVPYSHSGLFMHTCLLGSFSLSSTKIKVTEPSGRNVIWRFSTPKFTLIQQL